MKKLETKTTKNGNTVYYMVDENGKKRQVSRKTAQEFIASNTKEENKMENTVAIMTATAEDMELAIRLKEEAAELIELSESADIAETNSTDNNVGNLTDSALAASNSRLAAFRTANEIANTEPAKIDNTAATKMTKKAAKEQKWLADAKVDSDGKYQIVIDCDLDNRGDHKSWAPYTWIITNSGKRVRISYKFALELADSGRAIEVNKTESKKSKKAA